MADKPQDSWMNFKGQSKQYKNFICYGYGKE